MTGAVAMPDWVAPEGKVRDDLKLGDRVRFEAILMDDAGGNQWDEVGEPDDWAGWSRRERVIGQGIIVGLRSVYSGGLYQDDVGSSLFGDPPGPWTRKRERSHRAYLVALNLHHKPVHVLSDDVVLLEP